MGNLDEKLKNAYIRDNITLINILGSDELTSEEKEEFINRYEDIVDDMPIRYFLHALRIIDSDFIQRIDWYLKKRILSLSVSQIESLLYNNKHYRKISELSGYLLEQPWFKDFKEKHKLLETAYNLEKLVNEDNVDLDKLKDYGKVLVDSISQSDSDPVTFDMALKNYVMLLKRFNPDYYDEFKKEGYIIVDKQISNGEILTDNALIYDARMTVDSKSLKYVEYIEMMGDGKKHIAFFHGTDVCIDPQRKKEEYEKHDRKWAGESYLFTIGHELCHGYCDYYERPDNLDYDDLLDELRVYNSGIGRALSQFNREFYIKYHPCFSHEYIANIAGLKHMYDVLSNFPDFDKSAIEKITQDMANILLNGYCYVRKSGCYISPIEFSKKYFLEKDYLPYAATMFLLNGTIEMPEELIDIEKNLTEMEKFELGYFNKYLGALELIRSGKVKSTNLFNDLPLIYEKYKDSPEMKEYPHHVEEREELTRVI